MRFLIAALVLWVALTSGTQADYMAPPLCEQLTLPRAVGCEDSADGPSIYVIAPPVVARSRPGKLFINLWSDPAPPDELIVDASEGGACDMIHPGPSIYVIAPPVVARNRPGKLFINLWSDPAPSANRGDAIYRAGDAGRTVIYGNNINGHIAPRPPRLRPRRRRRSEGR